MQRRTFLALGGLLVAAGTVGGWTLVQRQATPLLLSARDDADAGERQQVIFQDGIDTLLGDKRHVDLPVACHAHPRFLPDWLSCSVVFRTLRQAVGEMPDTQAVEPAGHRVIVQRT